MSKYVRKLTKNSRYSYSISVPKEVVERYGWKSKQKMELEDRGRGVLQIKDWRKR